MTTATGRSEFIVEARAQIERRIAALEPLVVEFRILRAALAAIECWAPRPSDGAPRTRAQIVLEAIAWRPGMTPGEIATAIGAGTPRVYPALRTLEDRGYAHRADRRWYLGPSGSAVDAKAPVGPGDARTAV